MLPFLPAPARIYDDAAAKGGLECLSFSLLKNVVIPSVSDPEQKAFFGEGWDPLPHSAA